MTSHTPKWARPLLVLLIGCAALATGVSLAEEGSAVFNVRYRSADTVYLEGGRAAGLSVGDRLEIVRDGEVVARIEVAHVSEHSASCKILMEQQPIETGDRALFDGDLSPPPPPVTGEAAGSATDSADAATSASAAADQRRRRPRTRLSGSFTVDWESFTDETGRGWDYDRLQTRLSLRVKDIGGQPLKFRLRMRTVEWDRASGIGEDDPLQENRNRLYEVSLTYDPPKGRFSFSAGRLGTNPFVGIGYLDGIVGQARVGGGFDIGAFYGAQPVIEEFGIDNVGAKYGAYTRYRTNRDGGPRGLELYLAGIREDGEEAVSREYAALEIRYRAGRRWTYSQHSEIDFNQDWREEVSDSSVQLSNLAIAASGQLSSSTRLTVSYDRNQRYYTEDTRFIPEDLFDLLWRQGLRARLQLGRPGKLQFSVDAGARERQDDPDKTYTVGAGLHDSNVFIRGLYLGGTLSVFSNPQTDGFMGNFRVAKTFRGGHEVSLVLGALGQEYPDFSRDMFTAWARIGGWFELPAGLFARADLEYNNGDDLEGSRVSVGVGYRF
jgi:hypothetical protein